MTFLKIRMKPEGRVDGSGLIALDVEGYTVDGVPIGGRHATVLISQEDADKVVALKEDKRNAKLAELIKAADIRFTAESLQEQLGLLAIEAAELAAKQAINAEAADAAATLATALGNQFPLSLNGITEEIEHAIL